MSATLTGVPAYMVICAADSQSRLFAVLSRMTMTDLEDVFDSAADHLGALVTSEPKSLSDQEKLDFYGLYKQVTSGDCSAPKPGFFDRTGRSKWRAWRRRAGLSQKQAMQAYIELLRKKAPGWDPDSAAAGPSSSRACKEQGGMGPVFSTLVVQPTDDAQQAPGGAPTLHEVAGSGALERLRQLLESGTCPVDARDSESCSALHFAADRGQAGTAEMLLQHGANPNLRDVDGQTPLHYAALCEHKEVCRVLLAAGADASIRDAGGTTPPDVGPSSWTVWQT